MRLSQAHSFRALTIQCVVCLAVCFVPVRSWAGPTVVPGLEGQLGGTPLAFTQVVGSRVVPVGGTKVLTNRVEQSPIAGFRAVTRLEDIYMSITPVDAAPVALDSTWIDKRPPAEAMADLDNGLRIAGFIISSSGVDDLTEEPIRAFFDGNGDPIQPPGVQTAVPTVVDPAINDVGLAVDNQGRATAIYTEVTNGGASADVRAERFNALTGLGIGSPFAAISAATDPDIALLSPSGDRILIAATDFTTVRGATFESLSGYPDPVPIDEFPVNTTSVFANLTPAVAADVATGAFTVAWEALTGIAGDPSNIRARRFDANGDPIGDDFVVNTTTANAQGQPDVAYGPQGLSVIAWAGDSNILGDGTLDIFIQAYDPDGNPLGGEIRVNSDTEEWQDRPQVTFLPEPDAQNRPQFLVQWRDVESPDTNLPRGTGTSYRCFSIEGFEDPEIFADGFESGDTTSWSSTVE